jgi:hypothetical protein
MKVKTREHKAKKESRKNEVPFHERNHPRQVEKPLGKQPPEREESKNQNYRTKWDRKDNL